LALNLSKYLSNLEDPNKVKLTLDFLPKESEDLLSKRIVDMTAKNSSKNISNVLKELLPKKLVDLLLVRAQVQDLPCNQISKNEKLSVVKQIKHFSLMVEKNMGFDIAMTTSGGVDISQVDQKTMRVKKFRNLYVAGEVIDVDGISGGFNLQISWSTGYVAGTSANQN